jgi:hypothetical protein
VQSQASRASGRAIGRIGGVDEPIATAIPMMRGLDRRHRRLNKEMTKREEDAAKE